MHLGVLTPSSGPGCDQFVVLIWRRGAHGMLWSGDWKQGSGQRRAKGAELLQEGRKEA